MIRPLRFMHRPAFTLRGRCRLIARRRLPGRLLPRLVLRRDLNLVLRLLPRLVLRRGLNLVRLLLPRLVLQRPLNLVGRRRLLRRRAALVRGALRRRPPLEGGTPRARLSTRIVLRLRRVRRPRLVYGGVLRRGRPIEALRTRGGRRPCLGRAAQGPDGGARKPRGLATRH